MEIILSNLKDLSEMVEDLPEGSVLKVSFEVVTEDA